LLFLLGYRLFSADDGVGVVIVVCVPTGGGLRVDSGQHSGLPHHGGRAVQPHHQTTCLDRWVQGQNKVVEDHKSRTEIGHGIMTRMEGRLYQKIRLMQQNF